MFLTCELLIVQTYIHVFSGACHFPKEQWESKATEPSNARDLRNHFAHSKCPPSWAMHLFKRFSNWAMMPVHFSGDALSCSQPLTSLVLKVAMPAAVGGKGPPTCF